MLTRHYCRSHLDSGLAEVQPHGEFFPREHVRILGLIEGSLQLVQLIRRERGPAAPDLPRLHVVLGPRAAVLGGRAARLQLRPRRVLHICNGIKGINRVSGTKLGSWRFARCCQTVIATIWLQILSGGYRFRLLALRLHFPIFVDSV